MIDTDIDMTFEEYRNEFIDRLYDMLQFKDTAKELIKNISKIDFKWEYNNSIEKKKKGRSPNLRANIASKVYYYYMCYPDMR